LGLDAIRVPHDVETGNGGAARVGLEQGCENPDGGRLARPVRSQQGQQAPFRDIEVETIQGSNAAVVFHQTLGVDGMISGHSEKGYLPEAIEVRSKREFALMRENGSRRWMKS
jgi:hypothetical protein